VSYADQYKTPPKRRPSAAAARPQAERRPPDLSLSLPLLRAAYTDPLIWCNPERFLRQRVSQ
jgi:hypothetical protein